MKKYLPYLILALIFLLIKLNGFGIRLSDSNIYFYTGFQLLEGNLLYKDIFFTNFPLLPYISAFYYLIFFGNLKLYMLTPTLEVIATGAILYHIILIQKKTVLQATLVGGAYLFSFIILTTSDHQSGVFLASLFGAGSYLFYLKKRFVLSGIGIGLMLMTKAYFLPIFLALFVLMFVKERRHLIRFFIATCLTSFLILLPSLLFAREELFTDIVSYSLTRSQGISKINILRFFSTHDFLFVILLLYSFFRLKKQLFAFLVSLFGVLFIMLYQDIYYLYLNFLIPFLALSLSDFQETLRRRFSVNTYILPTLLIILACINAGIYLASYQSLQKLTDSKAIVSFLKNQQSSVIYGSNTITPALAYLSDKEMLNGIVDTNENIYRKGFLSSMQLTKDAISQNALLVSYGAYYPQFNIEDPLTDRIFERELVAESCAMIGSYPITTEGIENRLNFFQCTKSTDE